MEGNDAIRMVRCEFTLSSISLTFQSFNSAEISTSKPESSIWTDVARLVWPLMSFALIGRTASSVDLDSKRTNLERLDLAHSLGFNVIHPVPPGKSYAHDGDDSAINAFFDRAEELGIWIMYDMRHGKSASVCTSLSMLTPPAMLDLDAIERQVLAFRDRPNLLTWYIADEPDGPPTPPDTSIRIGPPA